MIRVLRSKLLQKVSFVVTGRTKLASVVVSTGAAAAPAAAAADAPGTVFSLL